MEKKKENEIIAHLVQLQEQIEEIKNYLNNQVKFSITDGTGLGVSWRKKRIIINYRGK